MIKEIYSGIVKESIYDENYAGNPQVIDGKIHGVCIDFSRNLIKKLRENNILCGLISTNTIDGFLHAAVIYKNEDEMLIADPVTDVKDISNASFEDIINRKNYSVDVDKYLEANGPITDYDDSEYEQTNISCMPSILRLNMTSSDEIKSNEFLNVESKV